MNPAATYESFEQLARPGDPDLTFDMNCLTVKSVEVNGREVAVEFSDGFGWWIGDDGARHDWSYEDGTAETVECAFTGWFPSAPEDLFANFTGLLDSWATRNTLLRLCVAPGRCSLIIEDRSIWLPLPSREFSGLDL